VTAVDIDDVESYLDRAMAIFDGTAEGQPQ
jgi:hypothetical protein